METLIDRGDAREKVIFETLSDGGGGESTGGGDLGETRQRMAEMADHARRSPGLKPCPARQMPLQVAGLARSKKEERCVCKRGSQQPLDHRTLNVNH